MGNGTNGAAGTAAGKGYTVPRNRKRDYLTTEERERRAERAMVASSELAFRAEQAAQRARLLAHTPATRAEFAAANDKKWVRQERTFEFDGYVQRVTVALLERER